ncbi:MAG: sugar transporter, partial [Cellvibrionales bacterium]|nr:sugar transporter [Cellvibrionales bacterium]
MAVTSSFLPPRVKFAYGVGSIAYGVKEQGFAYFLLMFYSTVVGLEPALAGTALLIALLTDAISDPIVGYWSDNTRTRMGRRHPFMYASAVPVSLCYFLIWQPPDWGDEALFLYLLTFAILIRTLITFFETPSSALMPELTQDYDERTSIQAWRHFFGWFGGALLTILMFAVLLVPTAEYEVGTLNREGYETYGVIAGIAIFIAILVSSIGTQTAVQTHQYSAPPARKRLTQIFAELRETLVDSSFFALFLSSMAGAVATGLSAGLTFIMMSYFWQLSSLQMFMWTCMVLVAATAGLVLAPRLARRLGKRHAVLALGGAALLIQPAPVTLRLLGAFPENGDPALFPLLLSFSTIELSLMISMQVVLASMVADLVESS